MKESYGRVEERIKVRMRVYLKFLVSKFTY